jgi:hypothetical protein
MQPGENPMRKEYLLGVVMVALENDGAMENCVFVNDGKDMMEEDRGLDDTREDGGENDDRVGRTFAIVGGVLDIDDDGDDDVNVDVLSQTSKLTCVR